MYQKNSIDFITVQSVNIISVHFINISKTENTMNYNDDDTVILIYLKYDVLTV